MEDTELVNYLFWPRGSWKAEWKTNKSFVVVLVVTSNYFRRFCDKLQHLLDIPTPSLDACIAACSVDYQRQVYLNLLQVKRRIVIPLLLPFSFEHAFLVWCVGGYMEEFVPHLYTISLSMLLAVVPKLFLDLSKYDLFNLSIQGGLLLCRLLTQAIKLDLVLSLH